MGVAAAAAEEAMNNIGGVMMLSYHPTMDRDTEQEAASISLLDHLPPEVPVSSSRAALLSPMGAMAIITHTGGKRFNAHILRQWMKNIIGIMRRRISPRVGDCCGYIE